MIKLVLFSVSPFFQAGNLSSEYSDNFGPPTKHDFKQCNCSNLTPIVHIKATRTFGS